MGLFERAKNKLNARYYGNLDEFAEMEDIQKQYWGWLIYTHKYNALIHNTIQYRYSNNYEDTYKFINPTKNVLKRVAMIKAQTYNRPPVRRAASAQLQKIIKNNVHRINNSLQYACRLLNACGNVLIIPVLATDRGAPSILDFIVVAPHEAHIEPCYTDYKYNVVARIADKVYIVSEIDNTSIENKRFTYVVNQSRDKNIYYADLGDPVWVSLENTTLVHPRCVGPVTDLIEGTIHIGELETFANVVAWLKSFRQVQATDEESVNPSDLIPGPLKIFPSNITAIDLVDKNDSFEKLIEQTAIDLAGQHGVSATALLGKYESENNWFSVSQELMQHWVGQLETWKRAERDLWQSVCNMTLINVPENEREVVITYMNPYMSLQDPQKDFDLHRAKVRAGYESTLMKVLEENPHLSTLEEAKLLYENNLQAFSEEIQMKRKLNIPDSDSPGLSPQDNGAMGVLGKAGPSMINNKDLEA
jgi:hypothetical protein